MLKYFSASFLKILHKNNVFAHTKLDLKNGRKGLD